MEKYNFEDRKRFDEDILRMLERGSLNDVKIELSDGEIIANKDILMARSDYFATMFSNDKFIEGETNTVDMGHCSKSIMEKIIQFLFTGAVMFDGLSLIQLLELSRLSGMLLLDKFQEEVDTYTQRKKIFGRGRKVEELPDLILALKYADQYNMGLGEITNDITEEIHFGMKIIPTNDNVKSSFKSLPFNLIRDIFLVDSFFWRSPTTTKQKFDSFIIWLSENEVTEEEEAEIVESFELDDFTVEELITTVRESGLYPNNMINERVLELFKEQGDRLQERENVLKETLSQINNK